jgi:glycosyltransferase involved in cell wall biosynthesis
MFDIPGGTFPGAVKRIAIWGAYPEIYRNHFALAVASNKEVGAELLTPLVELIKYGKRQGLDFISLDELPKYKSAEAFVFFDFPPRGAKLISDLKNAFPDSCFFLIILESPLVNSCNWSIKNHALFDQVFGWRPDFQSEFKYSYLPIPSPWVGLTGDELGFLRSREVGRRLVVNISSNKQSSDIHSLYPERVKAIVAMQQLAGSQFALYGHGWDSNNFTSFEGVTSNKIQTLSNFHFSICFENAMGFKGYITEKIMDCFAAGTIPLYLGASDIENHIPESCFIDIRQFSSYNEVYQFIINLSVDQKNKLQEAGSEFLKSAGAFKFSTEYNIATITGCIARELKVRTHTQPDISVIITSYNNSEFISEAINSALSATSEVYGEVIVLDNGSSDGSLETLAVLALNPRLKIFKNKYNVGSLNNHTLALKIRTGKYLKILHADDFLNEEHIRRAVTTLDQNADVALYYSRIEKVDRFGRSLGTLFHKGHPERSGLSERNEADALITHDCFVTTSAAVLRSSVIQDVGDFDALFSGASDWDYWVRVAGVAPKFFFSAEAEVSYRIHDSQDSSNFYSSNRHVEDHINLISKHRLTINSLPSEWDYLKAVAPLVNRLKSREGLFQLKIEDVRAILASIRGDTLSQGSIYREALEILRSLDIPRDEDLSNVQIVITFTGGLGAQLLSLSIYLGMILLGLRVYADLSYFTIQPHLNDGSGDDKRPSHWGWALKHFGWPIEVLLHDIMRLHKTRRVVVVRDGVAKTKLGYCFVRFLKRVFPLPEVLKQSDLKLITDGLKDSKSRNFGIIHFRRGDYKAVASHIVPYESGLNVAFKLAPMSGTLILVSDSEVPKSVIELASKNFEKVIEFGPGTLSEYGVLHLFRKATFMVMSNSQFSLVGAVLCNGLAVTPKTWFGPGDRAAQSQVELQYEYGIFKL